MDPTELESSFSEWRLPRTRGDGPRGPCSRRTWHAASPHTRGWTPPRADGVAARRGFPAHAGMDPLRTHRGRGRYGLPRTRGDGPGNGTSPQLQGLASPHTRGWTRSGSIVTTSRTGFPAHAGMDPTAAPSPSPAGRLPRTRGDGPFPQSAAFGTIQASPHTRGWTRIGPEPSGAAVGFPAHAGMDPDERTRERAEPRLPRTRGDGPSRTRRRSRRSAASPHTRGWTRAVIRQARTIRGFPAHAGMDPAPVAPCGGVAGLPRTRGDGPGMCLWSPSPQAASPHTRGWTSKPITSGRARRGFPAHAGMDPGARRHCHHGTRLPRTRGDGPVVHACRVNGVAASPHTRGWTPQIIAQTSDTEGFPAHAGMDPASPRRSAGRRRLPRTRGDGPRLGGIPRPPGSASPHTRGWTHWRELVKHPNEGFPAHAGMDREQVLSAADRGWLPRTRGDGPSSRARADARAEASPHTRGWTAEICACGRELQGFPAHAGMDRRGQAGKAAAGGLPRTRGDGPLRRPFSSSSRSASPHTRGWTSDDNDSA